ncbi:MAG: PKD domain-containing protein [Paludibacteraceae bacterium]|nr:PKD domain-containing protein [Paludibacteraceae bacterium]
MKNYWKLLALTVVAISVAACVDNIPVEEELPQDAVSFNYLINGDYALDYYVGSVITFNNTSPTQGTPKWEFGDGTTAEGDKAEHFYTVAGTYKVKLTIGDYSKSQVIMISDIKPLLSINPIEGGLCEVNTTKVSFSLEVPNPQNLPLEYEWIFPNNTKNASGDPMANCTDRLPGELVFGNVGSQTVRLRVKMDGRELEEGVINVQVGYNQPVPTLYYAVYGGHIMSYKLIEDAPEGMHVSPFDMGLASGQHPFNLLFNDTSLYILDCGKQFYYVNDEDGVLGDGKITVMSKDGAKVEMMLTNAGQAAFDDPFYGYIEGDWLYFANRNTGIMRIGLSERNAVFSHADYPYYVQHATLGYYNNGWGYGSIGGCFGKVEGVWYWTKFYNGTGIFRFKDSDILPAAIAQGDENNVPKDGIAIAGMFPKSFAYDKNSGKFYFSIFDNGYGGFYSCTLDELNAISKKAELASYKKLTAGGLGFEPNTSGNPASIEGTKDSEVVGICQMALDEATGCVYFGYRNTQNDQTCAPSGVYRYNPATDKVEPVIEGPLVYGLVVNNTPSKLF